MRKTVFEERKRGFLIIKLNLLYKETGNNDFLTLAV